MPVFDEDDKAVLMNDIDVPGGYTADRGRKTKVVPPKGSKMPSVLKKVPVFPIILVILIVLVGIRLLFLENTVSGLATEVSELKGVGGQLAGFQTSSDAKIEASNRERNKLKSEILQLRAEIDAVKAHQKHQAELTSQKRQMTEAKKKEKEKASAKKLGSREKRS
ncbi:MAG: hypothetical protein LBQ00_06430 [Syntrophobacterales bacterium]|jgi:hypothetical protein|nr:hypothetical protein [Syntrophobacterales bacterium]